MVISDTELVQAVAPELVKRLPEVDYLMTAEAKGICLCYEMSRLLGMKGIHRRPQVPSSPICRMPLSHKALLYHHPEGADPVSQRLRRREDPRQTVALIDDVIATGESPPPLRAWR